MTVLKEVGLEVEFFLLDSNGVIVESPVYNFPSDEMGFLIELRSAWGTDVDTILSTLNSGLIHARTKAHELGLNIDCSPYKEVSEEWQDYVARKYRHAGMPDNTRNIYSKGLTVETQHTGFRDGRATAGTHVHFSVWSVELEDFLWLNHEQVETIVEEMDFTFRKEIEDTGRIAGEYEYKGIGDDGNRPHGFEYRSLPATADLRITATEALRILNSIV